MGVAAPPADASEAESRLRLLPFDPAGGMEQREGQAEAAVVEAVVEALPLSGLTVCRMFEPAHNIGKAATGPQVAASAVFAAAGAVAVGSPTASRAEEGTAPRSLGVVATSPVPITTAAATTLLQPPPAEGLARRAAPWQTGAGSCMEAPATSSAHPRPEDPAPSLPPACRP